MGLHRLYYVELRTDETLLLSSRFQLHITEAMPYH